MTLSQKILHIYPELSSSQSFLDGTIIIQNDSDGLGSYIKEWNYSEPRPTKEQLDALT